MATSYGTHLQKGFGQLLEGKLYADVVLNVHQDGLPDAEKIPAHKFVLSMASEEFRLLLCT